MLILTYFILVFICICITETISYKSDPLLHWLQQNAYTNKHLVRVARFHRASLFDYAVKTSDGEIIYFNSINIEDNAIELKLNITKCFVAISVVTLYKGKIVDECSLKEITMTSNDLLDFRYTQTLP